MNTIWKFICKLFTKENRAKVWRILFDGAITGIVSVLTNQALMDAAFDISLGLLGLKNFAGDKAYEFNNRLDDWCSMNGVNKLSKADMNTIREVAYAAVRSQVEESRNGLHNGKR